MNSQHSPITAGLKNLHYKRKALHECGYRQGDTYLNPQNQILTSITIIREDPMNFFQWAGLYIMEFLICTFIGVLWTNCAGVVGKVNLHMDYWAPAVWVSRNVRKSSFIGFSINLSTWRPFSLAENAIVAYITCGYSVLEVSTREW